MPHQYPYPRVTPPTPNATRLHKNISEQTMKSVCLYDQLYDLCDYIGFRTAEYCYLCIRGRVCAERFLTCVRPTPNATSHVLGCLFHVYFLPQCCTPIRRVAVFNPDVASVPFLNPLACAIHRSILADCCPTPCNSSTLRGCGH